MAHHDPEGYELVDEDDEDEDVRCQPQPTASNPSSGNSKVTTDVTDDSRDSDLGLHPLEHRSVSTCNFPGQQIVCTALGTQHYLYASVHIVSYTTCLRSYEEVSPLLKYLGRARYPYESPAELAAEERGEQLEFEPIHDTGPFKEIRRKRAIHTRVGAPTGLQPDVLVEPLPPPRQRSCETQGGELQGEVAVRSVPPIDLSDASSSGIALSCFR